MTKFLFTVEELIEAGSFTKVEFQKAYNETKEAESKHWLVLRNLGQKKGVTSESFFEKADIYFNDNIENQ